MADFIPDMTSNTAPSGTASASTALSATYAAWKAMDNDNATWWSTTSAGKYPSWLMYDWGVYNTKIINSYTVRARDGADQTGAPKTFKLQGFDGSTYTDLDTRASETGWAAGEQRTYAFSNTTAYRGYRLYITDNNGGTYTEVAEFELLSDVSRVRVELAGVQVVCTVPRAHIDSAGVQVVCKDPKTRVDLAGIQVLWNEYVEAGGAIPAMWLGVHF